MTDAASRRRVIYRGSKIDLALEPFQRADGTPAERELVVHPGAVALVPLVDDQHVCLVENERYAAGKTLLEVPAGTIDPGESPERDGRARARGRNRLPRRQDHPHPRVVRLTRILDGKDVSLPLRRPGAGPADP